MQQLSQTSQFKSVFTDTEPTPGVLLTEGNFGGTLAAARSLGSFGVHVALADGDGSSVAGASRYVSRVYRCPSYREIDKFAEWLLAFGNKFPGYVLYGTSDDVVFLLSKERERLAPFFRMYQPSEECIYTLSNKQRLYTLAREIGIETPGTFYPTSLDDVKLLASTLDYPLLVKPKTQLGLSVNVKGILCLHPSDVIHAFRVYQKKFSYLPWALVYDPSLQWPMIQAFYAEASFDTYSLTGFLSKENDIYLVRGAQKVLQQPLKLGIGLAFESRPVHETISAQVRELALRSGYYGVFEAEFIHSNIGDRHLLIDFNPRFYGQMGFDVMRRLPLAHLVCAGALGDKKMMDSLANEAASWDHQVIYKYRIHWMLRALLTAQWLAGKMSAGLREHWLVWAREGNVYDPICDSSDIGPHIKYVWRNFWALLRHPRSALRYYFG